MSALYRRPFPFFVSSVPFFLRFREDHSSPAHVGIHRHAVDFLVPEGTLVCAPRDGVVVAIKDDSDRGGPDESFAEDGNYILIDHTSGSFAHLGYSHRVYDEEELGGGFNPAVDPGEGQYSILVHLARGSVRVKVGDRVRTGQIIARQGSTGWTYEPHIHMAVYHRGESVPITFVRLWN